ncbi:MAG: type II secretion system F family protein [Tindallia sp. MSAO_Bac2]|nr:MAG: type II secretion system F family protein [Tindallia sp. MSAO_Bac2]
MLTMALTMTGAFGMAFTIPFLIHKLIFGEKQRMDRRMDEVLGAKEVPIRKQELSAPLYQRIFKPMLGKMSGMMLSIVPFTKEEVLQQKVIEAGVPAGLAAREWMVIKLLTSLAFGGLAWMLHLVGNQALWQSGVFMAVALALGWFSIDYYLNLRIRKRKDEVQRSLPDMLDLLTVSVEAGLGFEGALMKIVEKSDGLLAEEFLNVLRETKMGKPRRDALRDMAKRINVESLSNFVGSIVLAEQLGISMGNVLRVQSQEMRQKRRQKAEELAMKAPVKMLIPMVMFIFPAIFVILLGPAMLQILEIF